MDLHKMEEFRSNLLLLLHNRFQEGLPINQLKTEYKQYFAEEIGPELILPRGSKNNKHWDALFKMKEFKEDFTLFYMGTLVYVKAIRKRSYSEMKFLAQLAKHSHLQMAKKAEFQCGCCAPDLWKNLFKEAAVNPAPSSTQTEIPFGHPEDIVVKIEPNQMMNNGEDDDNSESRGNNDGLYSLVQQGSHGNHTTTSYVNGGTVHIHDPSGSTSASNMSSNTNDGFMLDHQLRVQQHSSPQGQNLQAFASLLNSNQGNLVQTVTDASGGTSSGQVVGQPFFTFLLQNGELKVMQVVSSENQTANGESNITSASPTPNASAASPSNSPSKKSLPPKKKNPDITNIDFVCSMPGCGETFVIKQHLQNHERTCSLKKYPCTFPGCDRRFKNSKQRHAHMTSRHKGTENAFRCTVPECTAFFKTLDKLKVHESRCRFKYEQFQLMDVEEAEAETINNNNNFMSNHSSVPNLNSSTESIEPHPGSTNTTTAFTSLQAASIMPERLNIPVPIHISDGIRIKLENSALTNPQTNPDLQGFSTVDLSLVKSEIME